MFNLKDYIIKNLLSGYEDGTFTESKVMQIAVGYLMKGLLTEEDLAYIDAAIQDLKSQEAYEDVFEDAPEEEVLSPMDSDIL
jgi:hypothetical protein